MQPLCHHLAADRRLQGKTGYRRIKQISKPMEGLESLTKGGVQMSVRHIYWPLAFALVATWRLSSPGVGAVRHFAYSVLRTPYKKYTKGGVHSAGED